MPHADDQMSMDVGHALMIGQFIREIDATSVVEVGCCYGISTGAILDAFEERRDGPCELRRMKLLHLIDVKFQPSIWRMIQAAKGRTAHRDVQLAFDEFRSLSTYRYGPSGEVLSNGNHATLGCFYGEVVILDGDHSEENVMAEVDLVLSWPKLPRAIILHDTGRDGLPGPRAAVECLRQKWWSIYHNETAGPRASRGLTICTLDVNGKADYDAAFRILENGK
jgi:hypothetical protein